MQHISNAHWRPRSPEHPRPQYHLQHTMSLLDLHEKPATTWYERRSPSPTASSVSSITSRSATPTTSNNPWSNVMASPNSTNSSPRESPNRTPQYTSRSSTPVAPQPLRPISHTGFIPMSPPQSSGDPFRNVDYTDAPISQFPGSPNPYRQAAPSLPTLPKGFVTPALLTEHQGRYFELVKHQGWQPETRRRTCLWAFSNPKASLLLWLCDDVAAWPSANLFGVLDENMPFRDVRELDGIAADPRKVFENQWRVTAKELPQNGLHVEFSNRETVPLRQIEALRSSGFKTPEKIVDRVRWLGGNDDRIYVRKRFILTRPNQKVNILKQVQEFKQLDHKNIAKLLCSYSQTSPGHVAIVSAAAQYTLDNYLSSPPAESNARLLLDWIHDLSQALDYLHSQSICHRSIRPRKILIDGSRVYFASFGIGTSGDNLSPTSVTPQRLDQLNNYFQDQSYVYASPESIVSRGKKPGRPSDVFSLGCVFLSIMTVVQNQPLSMFTAHRASSSHDTSFHANLDRVASWRNRLHLAATSGARGGSYVLGRKERQLKLEADLLSCIERMVRPETKDRPKMNRLAQFLASRFGDAKTGGVRRRSMDGGYSGQAAAALGTNSTSGHGSSGIAKSGPQKPELSVFDGYFQQQKYEQPTTWGAN